MPRPKRAARSESAGLYIRVSLDRSAHGLQDEIISPDTQADRARAYCHAQGWAVASVEQDIDESAYRQHYSRRAGLMRLLAAVEAGDLTKIVVWKFSRLSRRLREFVEICDRVEAAGGGVVSVSEQVDTSTPSGRLIRNILASFAQFQSEELSEQISETWKTIIKRGHRPPGLPPFGTINERGTLKPDPASHHHLVEMYRVYVSTGSLKAVLRYLEEHRVPAHLVERWNLNSIKKILQNPAYIGHLTWLGETYEAQWDPIVPLELWKEAQEIFRSRRTLPVRKDGRLLTGLIQCSKCGRPMWIKHLDLTARGPTASDRVYTCLTPRLEKGCDLPSVDTFEAEAAVWETVTRLLATADTEALAASAQRQRALASEDENRRQQLLTERERIERAAGRLFDLLDAGDITREQFRQRNREYVERLETIQQLLDAIATAPAGPSPETVRQAARTAPAATTLEERREILRQLDVRVVVMHNKVYLEFLGMRIRMRARLLGSTFHFGEHYHRLDYRGPVLTDKQKRFLLRTYRWANKQKLATRLGRAYRTLVTRARALGIAPLRAGERKKRDAPQTATSGGSTFDTQVSSL